MLIDLQGLLPSSLYTHLGLRNLFVWYGNEFKDHLMVSTPLWLKSFLGAEMVIQLPFFFVAIRSLYFQRSSHVIRSSFIAYGAHVSTTVLPILTEFISMQKYLLCLIYMPYFVVPLALVISFGVSEDPFGEHSAAAQKSR